MVPEKRSNKEGNRCRAMDTPAERFAQTRAAVFVETGLTGTSSASCSPDVSFYRRAFSRASGSAEQMGGRSILQRQGSTRWGTRLHRDRPDLLLPSTVL